MTEDVLTQPLDELLADRWREGRRARGLDEADAFVWDRPECIGLDEVEEPLDAREPRRGVK